MSTLQDISDAYAAQRPASKRWFERAQKVLAGAAGHDLRYFRPVPLYIARGAGGRKWDVDGNEYIDFLMGNGALLLGHAAAEVVAAIQETVGRGTHFGNDHPLHIQWAEQVQQLIPSAERVRFVNSGTEATHLAIRIARAFTRRAKLLRFAGHFHGWHDDVVHGFQPPFDADGSLGVSPGARDHMVMIADGDLEQLEQTIARDRDVAAVILEASGGSWGRVPLQPEFLRVLREITARHNVVLIFDEVITGFRYSEGGAQQLYGVTPDLTCLAKILAGGMPGGAVVGRADIMAMFDFTGELEHDRFQRVTHQGTFNASPLSAAAGLATLQRIASGDVIPRVNSLAAELRRRWDEVLEQQGIAAYVYGVCSTFHVYFETDAQRLRTASSRAELHTTDAARLKGMPAELVDQYQRELRFVGLDIMSSTGGVLSAAHTQTDIDEATERFARAMSSLRDRGTIHTLRG